MRAISPSPGTVSPAVQALKDSFRSEEDHVGWLETQLVAIGVQDQLQTRQLAAP
jgi:bacterioferritin (cytochrome b1)